MHYMGKVQAVLMTSASVVLKYETSTPRQSHVDFKFDVCLLPSSLNLVRIRSAIGTPDGGDTHGSFKLFYNFFSVCTAQNLEPIFTHKAQESDARK